MTHTYSVDLTVNLPDDTEETQHIGGITNLNTIKALVDEAHPEWTSMVIVIAKEPQT